jgi:hypothetical protein
MLIGQSFHEVVIEIRGSRASKARESARNSEQLVSMELFTWIAENMPGISSFI